MTTSDPWAHNLLRGQKPTTPHDRCDWPGELNITSSTAVTAPRGGPRPPPVRPTPRPRRRPVGRRRGGRRRRLRRCGRVGRGSHPHCHLLHPPFLCAPFPHIRLPVPLHLHTHLRGNALPATRKQEPPPASAAGRGGRAAVAPRQRRPHRRSGARGGPRGGGSVAVETAAVGVDAPQ